MAAAVAAAAVVAKNARLFIVISLTLRNLAKADQDSELPTGNSHLSWGCRSDAGTVSPSLHDHFLQEMPEVRRTLS